MMIFGNKGKTSGYKVSRSFLTAIVSCAIPLISEGQNETSQWYFGNKAGLSFLTSPPTFLVGSSMAVVEGCASMSDAAGNLLFYTDGMTVWDKTHAVMANGIGLLGDNTPTQSSVIIKRPGYSSVYYIVTVQGLGGAAGVNYSTVDMSLASGQGSVTGKNLPLYNSPCTEKLTATRHCNGVDAWVLSHDMNSNQFRAFLVSASGINPIAVVSSAGPVENMADGAMKLSIYGRKGGLASKSGAKLFDFDNASGLVSNVTVLDSTDYGYYGCEFSSDGSKFYCTGVASGNTARLLQWDLCTMTNTVISQTVQTFTTNSFLFTLQLALDGKIYVAHSGTVISVINNPDLFGAACNFVPGGQSVFPKASASGLPNFMNSLYKFPAVFSYTPAPPPSCSTVSFTAPYAQNCTVARNEVISLLWNFGDPASGSLNQSLLKVPVHSYPGPGTYTVKLIVNFACKTDTLVQAVTVSSISPSFIINGPSVICVNESRTLSASNPAYSYTWAGIGSSVSIVVSPTATTVYTVTATDSITGCSMLKTHVLNVNKCSGYDQAWSIALSCSIYPNPANNNLTIEAGVDSYDLMIFDNLGRMVFSKAVNGRRATMDLSSLPAGLFTVQIKYNYESERLRFIKAEL